MRFQVYGNLAQHYSIVFEGKSLARVRGRVSTSNHHEVEIKLGASYPRSMPEIRWLTPIYHPNISEIGMVCLGGYGTHWVPSLNLDELCGMLWDMARFHNYDVRSPYNRDAALWVANQTCFMFPMDARPLRDLRAALGRIESKTIELPPPHPMAQEVDTETKVWVTRQDEEPEGDMPGVRAGQYVKFVRNFGKDLSEGPVVEGEPSVDPSRLIMLDDEPGGVARPGSPGASRLRASDEEILFID